MSNDPEFNQQSGRLGDFLIRSDGFVDSSDSMGISSFLSTADDVRFWAGGTYAARAGAAFRVTRGGALASTSGVIGGFTIGATTLSAGTGNSFVSLDSAGEITLGSNTSGTNYGRFNSTNLLIRTTTAFMSFLSGNLEIGSYSFPTGSTNILLAGATGNVTLVTGNLDIQAGTIKTAASVTWGLGAANVVSPTSPNRTLTVVVAGTTYYIAAKTTND
jgi:hypothetical protein